MTQRYHNPFSTTRLEYPTSQKTHYDNYAARSSGRSVDYSPFPRMIDLWWAGLSLAVRNELEPVDLSKVRTTRFVEGSIFDSDPWRIHFLRLIAMQRHGSPEILTSPSEVASLANGLAAAGVPCIVEMLTDGDQPPVWNFTRAMENLLAEED